MGCAYAKQRDAFNSDRVPYIFVVAYELVQVNLAFVWGGISICFGGLCSSFLGNMKYAQVAILFAVAVIAFLKPLRFLVAMCLSLISGWLLSLVAAFAHWTGTGLRYWLPLAILVVLFLPAGSLFWGTTPTQLKNWPADPNCGMSMPISDIIEMADIVSTPGIVHNRAILSWHADDRAPRDCSMSVFKNQFQQARS